VTVAAAPSRSSSLASSPDGQWVAIRRGDAISLLAGGAAPEVGTVDVGTGDVDVTFVGPPAMLVVVVRNVAPRVMLYSPPKLEVVARHDLDVPMRIIAVSGPRVVLHAPDSKKLVIVRATATALAAQTIELDGPLDFAVGLEKNQLLLSIQKKLEVWDAATGRPVLRVQLQLPPPPRTVGAAQGHIWITRPATDDIIIYRLSDGRPFRHIVGAPTVDVVASPASPIIIVGTMRHLVRVHCFAHSVTVIDAPWAPGTPIAQLAVGDDISLLGLAEGQPEPWRVAIAGAGAPSIPAPTDEPEPPPIAIAPSEPVARFRSLREKHEADRPQPFVTPVTVVAPAPVIASVTPLPRAVTPIPRPGTARNWRETLAGIGAELVQGATPNLAPPMEDSELAELADRLLLSNRSIRALVALYSVYLVGEPELSIADLAQVLGDWTEPLGNGELGALAMLKRKRGRVSLRAAVTDILDGAPPRAIRLAGHASGAPPQPARGGAWRYAREGKSDAELEAFLVSQFGRIAVIEGDPDRAIVEARLRGATAVAFHPPEHRPRPWPRDAGLVLVLYGSPSSWIADLPNLS
jgi:hypothetical protein